MPDVKDDNRVDKDTKQRKETRICKFEIEKEFAHFSHTLGDVWSWSFQRSDMWMWCEKDENWKIKKYEGSVWVWQWSEVLHGAGAQYKVENEITKNFYSIIEWRVEFENLIWSCQLFIHIFL